MSGTVDRDEIVAQIVAKLTEKHPDYDRDEVERVARAELAELENSPVQDFLLVLTERATKKRLKRKP
ncbi:three-helix bundle dimerization domain-containing protein [Agrococcus citreus]|uniref:three-helix bundle dimerization domain-containing protein n=1 Tax=Agrococcus citreus TaxID=84643 RepID=UPI0031D77081